MTAVTANFHWPYPASGTTVHVEIGKLITTLQAIDNDLWTVSQAVAGKAAAVHTHAISDIDGLQTALDGKASTSHTHALGSLSNVNTTGASDYQVLAKVGGGWQAWTINLANVAGANAFSAALMGIDNAAGWRNGLSVPSIADMSTAITNAINALMNGAPGALDTLKELADALGDDANFATTVNNALAARLRFDAAQTLTAPQILQLKSNSGLRFASGAALPTSDIGPIWHADYGWMIWQAFTANDAAYTGYASDGIGTMRLETQPTPRTGWVAGGVANLSRTTYAALRAWAMHNNLMVPVGSWAAGTLFYADNVDGTTFRTPVLGGNAQRILDAGRGVDASRSFGTEQLDAFQGHRFQYYGPGYYSEGEGGSGNTARIQTSLTTGGPVSDGTNGTPRTAAETRMRNTAFPAMIKF